MTVADPEPESKSVRLLIASDNPVSRIGFRTLLSAAAAVEVVGGGVLGRCASQVRAHRPDVVLLEGTPPPVEAVGRLARAPGARPRIIVVTAARDGRALVDALVAGAHGCLVYGHFEPRELADTLVAAGRGESALSQPATTALVRWLHEGPRRAGPGLTAREAEILELIAAGLTNRQIARRLVISEKTVKNHAHHIYKRLGAEGREHAAARWLELNSACSDDMSGPR